MRPGARGGRTPLALLLAAVLAMVLGLGGCQLAGPGESPDASSAGRAATDPESGLPYVEVSALPAQAQQTLDLIDRGGPFPYAKDGTVFGNRERLLPAQPRGYYREYTVPTPGSRDRGARRLVAGDEARQIYYTDDHYESFRRVRR